MADPFEIFFREYASAFNDFDAPRVAAYFHCPCSMVNGEFVAQLATEEVILENMHGVLAHHRAQNVGVASVSDIRANRLAENLAIVCVRWEMLDAEGEPLWTWHNTYNLVDHGSGWKILVSTTHAGPGVGDDSG